MLGFTEIAAFLLILGGVLFGLGYAMLRAWRFIHEEKRRHRLQAEEDERLHRKQMADDYAESIKMLNGMGANDVMSFQDYSAKKGNLNEGVRSKK